MCLCAPVQFKFGADCKKLTGHSTVPATSSHEHGLAFPYRLLECVHKRLQFFVPVEWAVEYLTGCRWHDFHILRSNCLHSNVLRIPVAEFLQPDCLEFSAGPGLKKTVELLLLLAFSLPEI